MTGHYWVRRKPPLWVAVAVAAAGLVLVSLAQGIPNRHSIEDNLTRRSAAALEAAGLTGVQVRFIGRDGELVVPSASDVDRARDLVAAVEGVRVVSARGPQDSARPATVTVSLDGERVVLSGTVPSEAVRGALAGELGGEVQNQLTVDPGVSSTAVDGLPAIVKAFGGTGKGITIELRDGRITLFGRVESAAVADAVRAAARQAIGETAVVDRLEVTPPPGKVQRALTDLPQVTFENNSATLTAAGRAAVAQAAAILRDNPGAKVRIEGHTDSTGTDESNLVLSRARAQSVLDALVSLGIGADRLSSAGFGESRPRVPDNTPQNQALNRRVEFIVLP